MTIDELRARAAQRQQACDQIKKMIVNRLDLEIEPNWITDDQPLFGRGLELDSLDILELYVAIEAEFGVALYDSEMAVFGSVSRLAETIKPELRAAAAV
ncbi:phosphopantetheine-binding protein [Streptosporangium amethystogenes]|jgi:acyl carrier protein|uniref:Acyl carrier protein n=1 Tax=Streptosporangium amethystogenes subsp. fukuiense TaxID=698418 RepID=A0ABW2T1Y4_9ACTN